MFLQRQNLSAEQFFELNPEAPIMLTPENCFWVELATHQWVRVASEEEGESPRRVHGETSSTESSSGFSGWTVAVVGLLGVAMGAAASLFVTKNTFARGIPLDRVLRQWKTEGFGLAHERYKEVVRNPKRGNLLEVDGNPVIEQEGPVFVYEDLHGDFHAANIVTGQEYFKTYPSRDAILADFSDVISPALMGA